MKTKKFLILILIAVLIVCSVFSDTSQTQENQAEQGGFFEFCSTEKIVLIVLVPSFLGSLVIIIIIFVCCCKIRKRDHGRWHYDPLNEDGYQSVNNPLNEDRYQLVNDSSNEDRYQSVNESQGTDNQRLQHESLEQEIETLKQERDEFKKKTESLEQEIETLKQEHDEFKKKTESLEKENEELKQERDEFKKKTESLEQEIKELKQEHDEFKKKTESLVKENEELKQECDEFKKKTESLEQEIKELKQERDKLEKKNESLVKDIEELKQDCDAIRKKFNAVGYVVERKWSSIVKDQAEVTLKPDTASPSLKVSEDGSQVRFKGEGSAEWPSVLGMEGFTSGSHYWEVEVGEKGYWALGVSSIHPNEKIIPEKPEEGYWLLRRWRGNTYEAVSQSPVLLTLQHKLYKVGVYLHCEKRELSFYNVYDGSTRYKIYTFNYKFTEVYPIFSPGSHDRGPLKITRFKSGDGNPN